MKYRFFHRTRTRAPVPVCWNVFTDHERLGEFTNTNCTILSPGPSEKNGLGCVRRLEVFGWNVDEIVNYWRPGELFGYHIINSEQVDFHQGIVRFFPTEEGCEWVYDMQNIPGEKALATAQEAGLSYRNMLDGPDGFRGYMADLEAECERRAGAIEVPSAPISTKITGLLSDLPTKEERKG
jgi:hypothetical protein